MKPKIETKFISKDQGRTRGGWSCYCEWTEIYRNGVCVAVVDEEHGQISLPHNPEGWRDRSYRGQVIPVRILDITDKYVQVEIQNTHRTIWKAFYFPFQPKGNFREKQKRGIGR